MAPQWCERHWDVVRKDESINGIVANLMIIEEFVNSPEVQLETGGQVANLNKVLESHSPLCCWLGDEKMEAIYQAARLAKAGPPDGEP